MRKRVDSRRRAFTFWRPDSFMNAAISYMAKRQRCVISAISPYGQARGLSRNYIPSRASKSSATWMSDGGLSLLLLRWRKQQQDKTTLAAPMSVREKPSAYARIWALEVKLLP